MESNEKKFTYALVQIFLDDTSCIFDTEDSNYINNDNIFVVGIFNFTEKEAELFKNKIAVYENKFNKNHSKQNFKCVYRLVRNIELSCIIDLDIPENTVIKCSFDNMNTICKEKNKELIKVRIYNLEDVKTNLRNSAEVQLDDITIDNIDRNGGLYYHKKTNIDIVNNHYLYFFNVELKKILSEITYAEFEKQMQDKVYKMVSVYLQKYHDGDRERMDNHTIKTFFNDKYFYWPSACKWII